MRLCPASSVAVAGPGKISVREPATDTAPASSSAPTFALASKKLGASLTADTGNFTNAAAPLKAVPVVAY